jgi:hypothetical protein
MAKVLVGCFGELVDDFKTMVEVLWGLDCFERLVYQALVALGFV